LYKFSVDILKDNLQLIILIAVLVIPWIIILLYLSSRRKKVLKHYRKLAEKYGFTTDESRKKYPSAYGEYRSRKVIIGSDKESEGSKTSGYTFVKVLTDNPTGFSFGIFRNSRQNKIRLAGNSVSSGDAEFDEKFLLTANNPVLAKGILNFNTKFKLLQAVDLGLKGEVSLNSNVLLYKESGLIKSPESMMRTELMLHELCDIADELKYA
jgi:hypothetical protein